MRYAIITILAVVCFTACAGGPGRQAVAVVNGAAIAAGDVVAMLPDNLDSARADTVKKQVLDGLITRKLFAQEAKREGMEKDAEYQVELEQKALVNQRLYDTITAAGNHVTEMELQSAYKLLQTEVHLRLITVPDESLAQRLSKELDQGAVFESLAVKHSKHPSAAKAGDVGFVPLLRLDEPLRTRVQVLQPGQHTQPTPLENMWQIVMLAETRPTNPPPPPLGEYRQELEFRLKQQRRREIATQYLSDMRSRITYNPAGLDILCKPPDSITEADKEAAVAYKDKARYVKVSRLLSVAQRFPPMLDTAMKKYTVRRTIEEDLIYEDALRRGLDKAPDIVRKLADKREEVLYKALYKREIVDKLNVTDAEVMDYFRQNQQNFTSTDSNRVMGMIRSRLLTERREARLQEYLAGLKAKAKITINQAALAAVKKTTKAPVNPKR
jgi:peptidyl-prolyl cis-trans isomerase C